MRSPEKRLPKGLVIIFGEKERRMAERKSAEHGLADRPPAGRGPDELVCFCFGHTAADIEQDALRHGRSTVFERIRAAKAAGGCQCARKNPKGV
jgi:hypothetical protein